MARITIVTPAGAGTRTGNRHTAQRWAAVAARARPSGTGLRRLGRPARGPAAGAACAQKPCLDRGLCARLSRAGAGGGADRHRPVSRSPRLARGTPLARARHAHRGAAGRRPAAARACIASPDARRLPVLGRTRGQRAAARPFSRRGRRPSARGKGSVSRGAGAGAAAGDAAHRGGAGRRCDDAGDGARGARLDAARAALPLARRTRARRGAGLDRAQPSAGGELGHGGRRERDLRGGAHRHAGGGFARLGQPRHARARLSRLLRTGRRRAPWRGASRGLRAMRATGRG